MTSSPDGVGATALLTAYARAEESAREDRLFDDPWARLFVTAAAGTTGTALPRIGVARTDDPSELWVAFREYFTGRTPFYDNRTVEAVNEGTRQVVVLAAGMDSRAFRLGLPAGTTVYEVDTAPVLEFKNSVLDRHGAQATCRRVCVPADLREPWIDALIEAGLNTSEPIVWIAEGLLMYLTAEQSDGLLATITGHSAPGTVLLTEYFGRDLDEQLLVSRAADEEDRAAAKRIAALAGPGPGVEPSAWLQRYGWHPEITDVATRIAASGRPVPPVLDTAPDRLPIWLLTGSR